MYLSNGKPMTYKEEGAAFFPPIAFGQFAADHPPATDVATSATVGLTTNATVAATATPGGTAATSAGSQTAGSDDSMSWTPWLVFAAGAVGGFFLFGKRRAR